MKTEILSDIEFKLCTRTYLETGNFYRINLAYLIFFLNNLLNLMN